MDMTKLLNLAFGNIYHFFKNISFRKEERGPLSWTFIVTLLLILVYGLVMLFSASYSSAYYYHKGNIYFFIKPQVQFAIVGVAVMFLFSHLNYHALRYANWYFYIITMLLLVLALFSPEQNGCHRWVYLFGNSGSLQPSELAKFSTILGISCHADKHYSQRGSLVHGIVLPLAPLVPMLVLLYLEPHNSAIILLCLMAGTMMLCGGCGIKWMPLVAVGGAGALWLMLTSQNNYVAQRLGAWGLTSGGDTSTMLWQTKQSLYSIASGGLTGLGIGNSRQKHLWLPEANNDFIFSILCEELGFIGAVICIALFVALIVQAILIALRAPDYYGSMLGIGIASQLAWQTFCHIGVVTATLPNTGISLPFFSSGGTSLMMLLGEMGILLSISRAGNARVVAQRQRQQAELAQKLNRGRQAVYHRSQNPV